MKIKESKSSELNNDESIKNKQGILIRIAKEIEEREERRIKKLIMI